MSDRPEVTLRRFEEGDAPAVHRWFNNPEATKSLMEQRGSFSLEEAEAWTRRGGGGAGGGGGGFRRGSQVRDRGRGLRRAGRLHRPLWALPSDRAGARGADR